MSEHSAIYQAVCFVGLEALVEQELRAAGLAIHAQGRGQLRFHASLDELYTYALTSRYSRRLMLPLAQVNAPDAETLRTGVAGLAWPQWLRPSHSIAVEFIGRSDAIRNSLFGAQCVKDGIVEAMTGAGLARPTVEREPDLLIQARLHQSRLALSIDLGGGALQPDDGTNSLPKPLANAALALLGWPCEQALHVSSDPVLLVQAARIARGHTNEARWGWRGWVGHDAERWQQACMQAADTIPDPHGELSASPMLRSQCENLLRQRHLQRTVQWEHEPVENGLQLQYADERLYEGPAVVVADEVLTQYAGRRVMEHIAVQYGGQQVALLRLAAEGDTQEEGGFALSEAQRAAGADFANRVRKNQRRLKGWAKQHQIDAYRVYDHDLPEFAASIERYADWLLIQESAPPRSVDASKAAERSALMQALSAEVLGVDPQKVVYQQRFRQRAGQRYQREEQRHDVIVREGAARFAVRLGAYHDTGLFLDHRPTRLALAQSQSQSQSQAPRRLLNLFAYTCTASVQAALAGGITTNVDLSQTYLAWGQQNFRMNKLDEHAHQFIRADVVKWLDADHEDEYDVILLDPPSYSNSKSTEGDLDVQRDHVRLIDAAMMLLAPGGELIFTSHLKRFKLDDALRQRWTVAPLQHHARDCNKGTSHGFRVTP